MTRERRELLYELYNEFKKDYGRPYTGAPFEVNEKPSQRSPRITFYESSKWFDQLTLSMDEELFVKNLNTKTNYWRYMDYLQYKDQGHKKRFMNCILHYDTLNFGLNESLRTFLRKEAVYRLGYRESCQVPVEDLHKLNEIVKEFFKEEMKKRSITYEE